MRGYGERRDGGSPLTAHHRHRGCEVASAVRDNNGKFDVMSPEHLHATSGYPSRHVSICKLVVADLLRDGN
jgi:hypothetical protein